MYRLSASPIRTALPFCKVPVPFLAIYIGMYTAYKSNAISFLKVPCKIQPPFYNVTAIQLDAVANATYLVFRSKFC